MDLLGSVGIIFKLTFQHILSALSEDSGSSKYGESESSGGDKPCENIILASLIVPIGRYNEWRVRGAEPIGIFIAETGNICAKQKRQFSHCDKTIEFIGSTNITLESVINAFPNFPIFTLGPAGVS